MKGEGLVRGKSPLYSISFKHVKVGKWGGGAAGFNS